MLLRVIHPNIDSIANVTGLEPEDFEHYLSNSVGTVLIYTPDKKWAFVPERHMDTVFNGIIDLLES